MRSPKFSLAVAVIAADGATACSTQGSLKTRPDFRGHSVRNNNAKNILELIFGNHDIFEADVDIEQEQTPVGEITNTKGGYEVAGFCHDGSYRVLSRKTGQLIDLAPKQLDKATLFAHFGQEYCVTNSVRWDMKLGVW